MGVQIHKNALKRSPCYHTSYAFQSKNSKVFQLHAIGVGTRGRVLSPHFFAKLDLTIRHIASGRTNPQLFLAANIIFLNLKTLLFMLKVSDFIKKTHSVY